MIPKEIIGIHVKAANRTSIGQSDNAPIMPGSTFSTRFPTIHPLTIFCELDWIVMRAMDKDRDRRYGGAGELAADLRRHLRHEPVLAGPPTATYRLKKLLRRYRGPAAAVAATFLALLTGAVFFALEYRRTQHNELIALDVKSQEAISHRNPPQVVRPEEDLQVGDLAAVECRCGPYRALRSDP